MALIVLVVIVLLLAVVYITLYNGLQKAKFIQKNLGVRSMFN